ncbi:MAG: nucleotidyltransferase domain-containing protein [Anaerolineales bacterium]|nr:nucleotidyltransferase domain-containing protein [Anaerolineales bacterium]
MPEQTDSSAALPGLSRVEAQRVAERCAQILREQFGATRVTVFGSVKEGEPWRADSDLDLAVEGIPPEAFFRAWAALENVAPPGLKIDLVDLADAGPELRARILGETPMPSDPLARLNHLIEDEFATLERIAAQIQDIQASLSDPPRQLELQALASYLHQYYTGIESILERLLDWRGEPKPSGRYWHADLLDQVAEPREGERPAIIDRPLHARLEAYRRFRHFFRHAYGYELDWRKMEAETSGVSETLARLRTQIRAFLDFLVQSTT